MPSLLAIAADVSSFESCQNLSTKVQQTWDTVDILINNAGKFPVTPFEEISYAEWREVCAINLDGPFLVTRAILPLITTSKTGRIINMSSGSIFAGTPVQCHYVTKETIDRETASWLRFYNQEKNLVFLPEEAESQRAEAERQRADVEFQRAEAERQRADRLAARLRELGEDPQDL